jgi:hypothetical protein
LTLSSVMIWTCKNLDSRVHNYWIHYMSLCILLKLSYMVGGFSFMCELKICLVTPYHFNKHWVISEIKIFLIFLGWLALIACWSSIKIFCQKWNAKHLLTSEQQRDKEKTCFVKEWNVIPKQNAKWQNSITI